MSPKDSGDLFMRSQDLVSPDDADAESEHYQPGAALHDSDSSVSGRATSSPIVAEREDREVSRFLRSQDLIDMDDFGFETGRSHRSITSLSEGWRDKLSSLKSRGFERMGSVRETMTGRLSSMHESTMSRVSAMRSGLTERADGVSRNLREHPAKWTGIAAGIGMTLGLAGRLAMKMRSRARRVLPTLVIVEAC